MERYHFVGIGGYSMSGIAMVLHQRGHDVTGSDMRESPRTERVRAFGIDVAIGHSAQTIGDADTVVYSTDVPWDNVELLEARRRGLRVVHRSEVLDMLMQGHRSIAVTGTHGKTTTSSLSGHLLIEAGLDPMVLVGGVVEDFGGSARVGRGEWIVVEADESDGSFLRYHPLHAAVTNMEAEHLEHFGGSFDAVRAAYRAFAAQVSGRLVLAADAALDEVAAAATCEVIRYGIGCGDYQAQNVRRRSGGGYSFEVARPGKPTLAAKTRLQGRHNVENTLAALALAEAAGVEPELAVTMLDSFHNAHRRFEVHLAGAVMVVDDYGHHPTEIRAVLQAARELSPKRLIVAFQPQRYTRTKNLWDAFVGAFDEADITVLTEIYAPGTESPIENVSGERLAAAVRAHSGKQVFYAPDLEDVTKRLVMLARPGDLIVTMGAGDIVKVAERLTLELGGAATAR